MSEMTEKPGPVIYFEQEIRQGNTRKIRGKSLTVILCLLWNDLIQGRELKLSTLIQSNAAFHNARAFLQTGKLLLDLLLLLLQILHSWTGNSESRCCLSKYLDLPTGCATRFQESALADLSRPLDFSSSIRYHISNRYRMSTELVNSVNVRQFLR